MAKPVDRSTLVSVCSQSSIDQSCLNTLWLQQCVWRAKEVEDIGWNAMLEPIK